MKNSNHYLWSFIRLFQTLDYFGIIPILNWGKTILNKLGKKQIRSHRGKQMGIVLVVGATGSFGKRVV